MTATSTARSAGRQARLRRAAAQAAQRRRRRRLLVASIASVAAVLATLVVVGTVTNGDAGGSPSDRTPVAGATLRQVTGVSPVTLDDVSLDAVSAFPRAVGDPALTADGKPLVLYIGAEYCPFCAAERWPLVQALSRFGTFTGLTETRSASNDVHPNTATFSFFGADYSSRYLSFDARELYTNEVDGTHYKPLQTLDKSQSALFARYGGGFPFIDFGGRYVLGGSTFAPDVLHELSFGEIAGSLADPASPVAQGVLASANVITAALCDVTGGKPADVCTAPGVTAAASKLHG